MAATPGPTLTFPPIRQPVVVSVEQHDARAGAAGRPQNTTSAPLATNYYRHQRMPATTQSSSEGGKAMASSGSSSSSGGGGTAVAWIGGLFLLIIAIWILFFTPWTIHRTVTVEHSFVPLSTAPAIAPAWTPGIPPGNGQTTRVSEFDGDGQAYCTKYAPGTRFIMWVGGSGMARKARCG